MSECSESVKRIAIVMRRAASQSKNAGKQEKASEFDGYADQLEQVGKELVRLAKLTTALPSDLGNLHELPQELLNELSVAKTDEFDHQLVTVINSYGGEASLDQILIGLYKKFAVTQKRRFTQNKLYRMTKAGVVWSAGGKKGIYTTSEPSQATEAMQVAAELVNEIEDEIPL